ncbi:hypothetical protein [Actinomyces sp. oral taxon 448]|jgi:hypothetical protein|uniref:hypothetical protein n=1 Tax=Actinomyces sp. oral taxon 448 TaxID=712124 RepID=UPI00021899CA|nr:hypothetical protein [Actinomyces sp. oral taxon 448]EGQ74420.1 hypothetical protein HMPREF9062_0942 [Actinomyces sp. oral taxon 448 str. F0400]
MPRPTSPLPRTVSGRAVEMSLPDTWAQLDPEVLRETGAPPGTVTEFIDLACAEPLRGPGFAENCVVTVVALPTGTSEEDWYRDSTAQIMSSIPGVQMIDMSEWDVDERTGLLRSGVYISDTVSVTFLQWSWVGRTSRRGITATFSCPTSTCAAAAPRFSDMALTLKEI